MLNSNTTEGISHTEAALEEIRTFLYGNEVVRPLEVRLHISEHVASSADPTVRRLRSTLGPLDEKITLLKKVIPQIPCSHCGPPPYPARTWAAALLLKLLDFRNRFDAAIEKLDQGWGFAVAECSHVPGGAAFVRLERQPDRSPSEVWKAVGGSACLALLKEEIWSLLYKAEEEARKVAQAVPVFAATARTADLTPPAEARSPAPVSTDSDASGSEVRLSNHRSRPKREAFDPRIWDYLARNPYATIKELAAEVRCSTGTVHNSQWWKLNQQRLRLAKKQGIDPIAVPLSEEALERINTDGNSHRTQLHAERERNKVQDDLIDERDALQQSKITNYLERYPDASEEEVARECNCHVQDVRACYKSRRGQKARARLP
ncbi:MAG: hypothetical protein ACM359_24245 [Bacillota bacterium]